MKKLVACALLGLGLTQSLVACSDDDDDTGNTAGTAGTAGTSAGAGGKSNGGSANGGTAGKGNGGTAGNGGSAGKGGTGGKGGNANVGGDEGVGGEPTSMGGETSVGGDTSVGGEGTGGAGGEGGAPPVETVTATAYWLNHYCEAQATETLECEFSESWLGCYQRYYGYVSDGSGELCPTDSEANEYANTFALIAAMDAAATACVDPEEEDWRCNLDGEPEAKVKACRDAAAAAKAAQTTCVGPQ